MAERKSRRVVKSAKEKYSDSLQRYNDFHKDKKGVAEYVTKLRDQAKALVWFVEKVGRGGRVVDFHTLKKVSDKEAELGDVYRTVTAENVKEGVRQHLKAITAVRTIFAYSRKRAPTEKKSPDRLTGADLKTGNKPTVAGPAMLHFIQKCNFGFDLKTQTPNLFNGVGLGNTFLYLFYIYIYANKLNGRVASKKKDGSFKTDKKGNKIMSKSLFQFSEDPNFVRAFSEMPSLMWNARNEKTGKEVKVAGGITGKEDSKYSTFTYIETKTRKSSQEAPDTKSGFLPVKTIMEIKSRNIYPTNKEFKPADLKGLPAYATRAFSDIASGETFVRSLITESAYVNKILESYRNSAK